jgi:hypothetical protein
VANESLKYHRFTAVQKHLVAKLLLTSFQKVKFVFSGHQAGFLGFPYFTVLPLSDTLQRRNFAEKYSCLIGKGSSPWVRFSAVQVLLVAVFLRSIMVWCMYSAQERCTDADNLALPRHFSLLDIYT